MKEKAFVHPYIPNSAPEVLAELMREVGITDLEELYSEIPAHLRFRGEMDLPEAMPSEYELRRHLEETLGKNTTCKEYINFLGAGCWQHHVPAVVDEIVNRAEFVSAYCGGTYSDHGKFQARFEFYSMLAEMLNVDAVSEPIYDWGTAAGFAIRMASRITGRNKVLIPANMSPERLSQIKTLCQPEGMENRILITQVGFDTTTGNLDLKDLAAKLDDSVAAVYLEVPGFFGNIEDKAEAIFTMAKEKGALALAGVDPVSLGVIKPPADYGADIICGDLQSIGVHMLCGGGQSGFIAFRDEPVYLAECPLALYTIAETNVEGQYGYAEMLPERTSYEARDKAKDWVATASGLWTIAAAVYMALMGPAGMREIGETILQNANYAKKQIGGIKGAKVRFSTTFKEFVVNFDESGKTVEAINLELQSRGIFGGFDLSKDFPDLGNSALYCVTEVHTLKDIETLVTALKEVLK
ncbi:MAG: aminomethyl-transferring glycine dehydrogenase [Firmicutes bacterium HGW-Firmicutes-11]|jgi:glycine dehydrogenase subunit 1|nr:MAG: aminomethyl-transferring glycine dehydrogenase [Firmicutes bacterium HGW-Firmicutes-11]